MRTLITGTAALDTSQMTSAANIAENGTLMTATAAHDDDIGTTLAGFGKQ